MTEGKLDLRTRIMIRRFMDGRMYAKNEPYDVGVIRGNVGLNEGIGELINLLIGAAASSFHSGAARVGVGTATNAEVATQTGLLSAAAYQPMDATYPIRSGQAVSWRGTFGGGLANAAWQEFTVANASGDAAKNLFRKASDQGTKTSGQTWELTCEVTLT